MKDVPGLKDRVRVDGVIGSTANFGSAIPQGMQTPLDFVVPRPDLDELFTTLQDNIRSIDFSKVGFTKEELLDALLGMKGTNLRELMSEIEEKLGLNIREHQVRTVSN
jgi:ABC-type transporter Mla subunit MlaD